MTLTRPSAFHYNGAGSVVPFHFQDNQPEVKGSVDGVAGLFTIDTGDSGSLLLIAPFARRYDLVTRYQADIPYSGRAVGGDPWCVVGSPPRRNGDARQRRRATGG